MAAHTSDFAYKRTQFLNKKKKNIQTLSLKEFAQRVLKNVFKDLHIYFLFLVVTTIYFCKEKWCCQFDFPFESKT